MLSTILHVAIFSLLMEWTMAARTGGEMNFTSEELSDQSIIVECKQSNKYGPLCDVQARLEVARDNFPDLKHKCCCDDNKNGESSANRTGVCTVLRGYAKCGGYTQAKSKLFSGHGLHDPETIVKSFGKEHKECWVPKSLLPELWGYQWLVGPKDYCKFSDYPIEHGSLYRSDDLKLDYVRMDSHFKVQCEKNHNAPKNAYRCVFDDEHQGKACYEDCLVWPTGKKGEGKPGCQSECQKEVGGTTYDVSTPKCFPK